MQRKNWMKVGIIGNGNLGAALARLFNANGFYNFNISDVDKHRAHMRNKENIQNSDVLFLCVKPSDMVNVLPDFRNTRNKVVVSSAAGISIADIEKYTWQDNKVVRIMPNLTIQYGKGTIPYYVKDGEELPTPVRQLCSGPKLLKCQSEELLNLSTICNGSMPAFLAYYAREYVKFATDKGFSNSEAVSMLVSAMDGTSSMLKEHSFDQITHMVSSKNGVTQKALRHLDHLQVPSHIRSSLQLSHQHL